MLQNAIGEELYIFPKVRMADLLVVRKGTEKRQGFFNKISAKHVDFVLCRPDTIQPVLIIELDDSSHDSQKAKRADEFKDKAFEAAGMKVLRFKAKEAYVIEEVRARIVECLAREDEHDQD